MFFLQTINSLPEAVNNIFKYGYADVSIGIRTNKQSVNEATTTFKKIANDKENATQHQH